jgi:hypothetical protein
MNFHRLRGRMNALAALSGAGAVAALAAMAIPHPGINIDASTARATAVPAATATWTAPPSVPQISFAAPPVVASPCQPREVLPCRG